MTILVNSFGRLIYDFRRVHLEANHKEISIIYGFLGITLWKTKHSLSQFKHISLYRHFDRGGRSYIASMVNKNELILSKSTNLEWVLKNAEEVSDFTGIEINNTL